MSTTTSIASAPAVPGVRTRRLVLVTTGRDDVLVRVLTLLRRRGCRIMAVDFQRADRHRPERFVLALDVPPRVERALEPWLLGLVDVVAASVR